MAIDMKPVFERDEAVERFGWPTCAVCKTRVERLETLRDPIKRQLVVVALCHGESEETFLNDSELMDLERRGVQFGIAFADKVALGGAALARRDRR